MKLKRWFFAFWLLLLGLTSDALNGQSLKGSPYAMREQFNQADLHDFTRLLNAAQLWRFVKYGFLVRLDGNKNYSIYGVSHHYTRPATKLFVERISSQHRLACGEKMVVTSLTRPVKEQPRNASKLSVHPHGMSVDFRASPNAKCRRWLEKTLLSLEKQGVIQATRERRPPHYHVAVYSEPYKKFVAAKAKAKQAQKVRPAEKSRRPVVSAKRGKSSPKRR